MKTYLKLLIVPLLIATACSPSYVGTSAFQDDIYFVPGEAPLIEKEMAVYTTPSNQEQPAVVTSTKVEPTAKTTFKDDRDFKLIEEQYLDMLNNDSIQSLDTTIHNEDQGYYLGNFNGNEWDREEAESLRRWYPQGFGYYDNSGYNTAMWLAGDPDWNVYVDGNSVWWTPTWTNYNYYNAFRFSPVRYGRNFAYDYPYYGSSFGFGYGYYDDFYWSLNFGWGLSHYSHYPYYSNYPYYGHGHHHHGGYYGHSKHSKNYYGRRTSMGSKAGTNRTYTNRSAATRTNGKANRINRSEKYSRSSTNTTSRRSANTSGVSTRRSSAAQKYGSRNSRSSYNNRMGTGTRRTNTSGTIKRSSYNGKTTRYGTQTRSSYNGNKSGTTTRRRTTHYTKPQNNTRPSYNKSGTRRSSTMRSSGTRSSGYSKVRSSSNYNRSSSNRSSSGSAVRSTRSSSRSSGSAVRSSGSSSRSSGSSTRSSSGGSNKRRR